MGGGECKGMFGRRKMVKVKSTAGCRMTYNLGKVHGFEGRDLSSPEVVPGFEISAKFRQNSAKNFIFVSYREKKFRCFSENFV